MSNEELACRAATPREELERQIMDSSVAKTEREWWCRGYIESLRAELVECERERGEALKAVDENWISHRQLVAARKRAERLEAAIRDALHTLESYRIWGGQEWSWESARHPLHAKRAHDKLRAALEEP